MLNMNLENVRIFLTHVRYWYESRDILVPILHAGVELVPIIHGVKFMKCEIYGST